MTVDTGDAPLLPSLPSSNGGHNITFGGVERTVTDALSSLARSKGQGHGKIPSLRAVAIAIGVKEPSDHANISTFLKVHKTQICRFVFLHPNVRELFVDAQKAFLAPYKLSVSSVGEFFHSLTGLPGNALSEIAQKNLKAASFGDAPGIDSLVGFKIDFIPPFETAAPVPGAVPGAASELPGRLAISIGIPIPLNSSKVKLQGPQLVDHANLAYGKCRVMVE